MIEEAMTLIKNLRGDFDELRYQFFKKLGASPNGIDSYSAIFSTLNVKGVIKTVALGDDIQLAINEVSDRGGGEVKLAAGTYSPTSNITMKNGVSLVGAAMATTIIDFGSTSNRIIAAGTNMYTTGTVSISSGVTVTGSSTSWLSSGLVVGDQIFLDTQWYKIAAISGDTTIILAEGYSGSALSGATYRAGTIVKDVEFEEIKVTGSTSASGAIDVDDCRNILFKDVDTSSNAVGSTFTNVSEIGTETSLSAANTSHGSSWTNCSLVFATSFTTPANGGSGLVLDNVKKGTFLAVSSGGNTADGYNITNCGPLLITAAAEGNGGQGIEVVSGSNGIIFLACLPKINTSDGIKLTATADKCRIIGGEITGNGGYGVNIAASTCDDNIIVANNFATNTSGAVNDSGTGTIVRGNIGVSDNSVSSTTPSGTIAMWGTSTAPTGWLLCDGAAVSRTTYATLFGVISTTYGTGDGSTTFNLPSLKGRVPVGLDSGQTEFDAMGETGGSKTHTLTSAEMPAHTHNFYDGTAGGGVTVAQGTNGGNNVNQATSSTGGGGAHNNLQPYLVLTYIIKT